MTVKTYWKPEPRPRGVAWWSMLIPALVYVLGVIVYSHAAFVPDAGPNGHALGSALMVIGGEAGTLAAVSEVFRKYLAPQDTCNWMDWAGILVSLIATLGNLFVVYSTLTSISALWVSLTRMYGPLVLLLCSGIDFYVALMEFGFFTASFERRWKTWNEGRHNWEAAQARRKIPANVPELPAASVPLPEIAILPKRKKSELPEVSAVPKCKKSDWLEISGKLNGSAEDLTAISARALISSAGFSAPSARTIRNWLTIIKSKAA